MTGTLTAGSTKRDIALCFAYQDELRAVNEVLG